MIVARISFDDKLLTYTRRGQKQVQVEHKLYLNGHNLLIRIHYSVIKWLNSMECKNVWIENNYTDSMLNAKYDYFFIYIETNVMFKCQNTILGYKQKTILLLHNFIFK